jgi:SAM-dependent methyltransferase
VSLRWPFMSYSNLISWCHRCTDAMQAWGQPRRRAFRRELLCILQAARTGWPSADYGAGYLYQSSPPLGLRGFRRTDSRVAAMHIGAALTGQRVLEIGCNTGFLALALSATARHYQAFDNNPFLIDIARLAARTLGTTTASFSVDTIESFVADQPFDVVLSFANHSTWDGNLGLSLPAYFQKLQQLLVPGGRLYFESHHPALESGQRLTDTLGELRRRFVIDEQRVLPLGSAWDRGRTFVAATSRRTG